MKINEQTDPSIVAALLRNEAVRLSVSMEYLNASRSKDETEKLIKEYDSRIKLILKAISPDKGY